MVNPMKNNRPVRQLLLLKKDILMLEYCENDNNIINASIARGMKQFHLPDMYLLGNRYNAVCEGLDWECRYEIETLKSTEERLFVIVRGHDEKNRQSIHVVEQINPDVSDIYHFDKVMLSIQRKQDKLHISQYGANTLMFGWREKPGDDYVTQFVLQGSYGVPTILNDVCEGEMFVVNVKTDKYGRSFSFKIINGEIVKTDE